MKKPLVHKKYLLEKFPGKGGWTFARIPEIKPDKHAHFGWVKVKGRIDDYEIKNYRLAPMGNGSLFLPVKAAIRKQIGKQAGDYVTVVLEADNDPTKIPAELLLCLKDEPVAHRAFMKRTDAEQQRSIDWIYSARTEETKADRIVQLINLLASGSKAVRT